MFSRLLVQNEYTHKNCILVTENETRLIMKRKNRRSFTNSP